MLQSIFETSKKQIVLFQLLAILLCAGCQQSPDNENDELPVLKEAFKDDFLIGAALNVDQIIGNDINGAELVKTQYNTITPENILKWVNVHPQPDSYNFDVADQYVQFGEENGMFIVGHTLIWHNQTPGWVFVDDNGNPLNRNALLERMRDHIHSVVGRYSGRIHGWDVVNEALNDDGTLRETPWLEIIGEDYIEKAFEYAHEADPDAELYYNDYSLENPEKRAGAIELIKNLQAMDIPITGVGTQGHFSLNWPSAEQAEATVRDFANLDIDVMVTELDIDVLPSANDYQEADISTDAEFEERLNPWPESLPASVQDALSQRYAELFNVYYNNRDAVTRITFWGVSDGDSWKNNWPIRGRTNYPLLFDRKWQPKPAFYSVIEIAS
jgi:endo-1,4-beta-xylanase